MCRSLEARVVGIDQATVFVATEQRMAAFRRDALPPQWWRHLKLPDVNLRVAALILREGVPETTPFLGVPSLYWPG
jgi:hypothetical protein